jgi:hypothetical protein
VEPTHQHGRAMAFATAPEPMRPTVSIIGRHTVVAVARGIE